MGDDKSHCLNNLSYAERTTINYCLVFVWNFDNFNRAKLLRTDDAKPGPGTKQQVLQLSKSKYIKYVSRHKFPPSYRMCFIGVSKSSRSLKPFAYSYYVEKEDG